METKAQDKYNIRILHIDQNQRTIYVMYGSQFFTWGYAGGGNIGAIGIYDHQEKKSIYSLFGETTDLGRKVEWAIFQWKRDTDFKFN